MAKKNVFYAQSGGPTAVINATACALIQAAAHNPAIGKVYAGQNGIIGALQEELIDTSQFSEQQLHSIAHSPGSAFGSCRYRLRPLAQDDSEYRRLIEVFSAHDIGYFFYNGGGDSQDTTHKVSQISQQMGYPLTCIGLPKTIDNDLPLTDCCPGFGSVGKYIATSILEASLDLISMARTSTKVFVMEVMGRHTGWLAATAGIASTHSTGAPQVILFPEIAFQKERFLRKVELAVKRDGFCSIVVSEGIRDQEGHYLSESKRTDAFGHHQLGGIAPKIAHLVQRELHLKQHYAVVDYLQRAAHHIASKTDFDIASRIGAAAIEKALAGENNVMLTVVREQNSPFKWHVGTAPLAKIANTEKSLPRHFISEDGMHITPACLAYLQPLIQGEVYPHYQNGIPEYRRDRPQLMEKKTRVCAEEAMA